MKTYIDIYLSSEGAGLEEVLDGFKRVGLEPISGLHDFLVEWENEKEFIEKIKELQEALRGKKVLFKFETILGKPDTTMWPPLGLSKE